MDKNVQVSSFFENGVFQDFYQILEVSRNASEEEIKKSFRRLSRLYHPDMPTANEEKMKRIGIAYGILKKPELKQLYDEYYSKYKNGNSTNAGTYSTYTKNNSSTYTQSNYQSTSTSQPFTENEIRNILRKNHYSEFKIEDFLYWCRKDNIKIYSMTGLSTYFSRYLWSRSEQSQTRTSSQRVYNTNTSYKPKTESPRKMATSSRNIPSSSNDGYVLRQILVRQMILEEMRRYYLYQSMMRNISNIRFYTPVYSNIRLYQASVYTSNVYFYSTPRRSYVYKMYR